MGRDFSSGLTDAQHTALTEFLAGHITAGEFSRRLRLNTEDGATGAAAASGGEAKNAPTQEFGAAVKPRPAGRRLAWMIPLVAAALAGGAIGASLGSTRPAIQVHRSHSKHPATKHAVARPHRHPLAASQNRLPTNSQVTPTRAANTVASTQAHTTPTTTTSTHKLRHGVMRPSGSSTSTTTTPTNSTVTTPTTPTTSTPTTTSTPSTTTSTTTTTGTTTTSAG